MRSLVHNAVHCVWNDWVIGVCSVTCGEGIRTNTRTQKEAAQFGGDECEGLASSTESCYDQDCPGIFLLTHSFVVLQSSYYFICQDDLIPLILCLFTDTPQPTVATTHAPEPGIYLQVQANSNKHF